MIIVYCIILYYIIVLYCIVLYCIIVIAILIPSPNIKCPLWNFGFVLDLFNLISKKTEY